MVLAEVVGAASLGVSGVFGYNRKNFMYDREMRQSQEIKIMQMRIEMVDVWREDVRDMVELTEGKMDTYMLVAALQCGFCVALYTEGRLEMGTPEWVVWQYIIALCGSFMFLLMSVWFSMHAAVVAQASSVRVLTQLVRPPIPSWEQLEAMRTYGAAFEGASASSMLRVPILQTATEGLRGGPGGHAGSRTGAAGDVVATDPWGLERRGDNLEELQRRPIVTQRHVRLVREASRQWQAYDAFARASMTLGTVLQCTALSYYILGYLVIQNGSPWAALSTMAMLLGIASILIRLDISMTKRESILVQFLLFSGPAMASVMAIESSTYKEDIKEAGFVVLMPASYLMNAGFVLVFQNLCRVFAQPNGVYLPTGFRSVLYLDVFRWLVRDAGTSAIGTRQKRPKRVKSEDEEGSSSSGDEDNSSDEDESSMDSELTALQSACDDPLGLGAALGVKSSSSPRRRFANAEENEQQNARMAMMHGQSFPRSSMRCPARSLRPEDIDTAALPAHDPRGQATALGKAAKALSAEDSPSKRQLADKTPLLGVGPPGMIPALSEHAFSPRSYLAGQEEGLKSVTGRDMIEPGELPWHVFQGGTRLLAVCWTVGAMWSVAQACGVPGIPDTVLPQSVSISGMTGPELPPIEDQTVYEDFLGLVPDQRMLIEWPNENFKPWGMSCDSTGTHFAISDEFQLFSASAIDTSSGLRLTGFRPAPMCPALEGQALQDIAVVCSPQPKQPPTSVLDGAAPHCKVLVLHERGQRLAECDLTPVRLPKWPGEPENKKAQELLERKRTVGKEDIIWNISSKWLRGTESSNEQVISAATDPRGCEKHEGINASSDPHAAPCLVVGTDHGRILRLRRNANDDRALVPSAALLNWVGKKVKPAHLEVWATSLLHTLPGGFLLSLQDQRRSILAVDVLSHHVVGRWKLPERPGRIWTALAGGDTHLFVSSEDLNGGSAELWRFVLPKMLVRNEHPKWIAATTSAAAKQAVKRRMSARQVGRVAARAGGSQRRGRQPV